MFRLCSHPVSVATIKLCCCSMKAAINNIKRVPIKLYLQEQAESCVGPMGLQFAPFCFRACPGHLGNTMERVKA